MSTSLQQRFTKLKEQIDNSKLLRARFEANLEQQEAEQVKIKAELKELVGTDDLIKIGELEKQLEEKITKLTEDAEKILAGIEE